MEALTKTSRLTIRHFTSRRLKMGKRGVTCLISEQAYEELQKRVKAVNLGETKRDKLQSNSSIMRDILEANLAPKVEPIQD